MKQDDYAKVEAPTFVYVMECGGKVKIGVAREPEKRLRQLQLANPGAVSLVHSRVFSTRPSAVKVERGMHKRFAGQRMLGEWFDMPSELAVAAIVSATDPETHHGHWHPDLPYEIGAEGVIERWRWFRSHDLVMGQ